MELDHVFVMCDVGAPEASALLAVGLREGPPNTHPGQGTACRRFFFRRMYLELLWIADADEAEHAGPAPARLLERWTRRRAGASPFGLVLRGGDDDLPDAPTPWPAWNYRAPYLSPAQPIAFAEDAPLHLPEVIVLPWLRSPAHVGNASLAASQERDLLDVECTVAGRVSVAARALHRSGLVRIVDGAAPLITLTYAAAPVVTHDLRPTLPMRLRW